MKAFEAAYPGVKVELQIVEGARQLRGELSEDRQVPGATTALISGHGGNESCHSTLILKADR